ncbi:hypothetical protein A0H81_10547 [Grifola frondosa]|uniref:Uncharacterized protein n=1 Tax=Grifola frondosa TaxID=5627 RepID=A0A1C7LYM8_GRIFR|nr:hypothetical protein A0H81_10547 [Grifola frondosa]
MRLLHTRTLTLKEFPNSQRAEPYAILSHVWRKEEVLFHHIQDLNIAKKLRGFPKVFGCCERARDEGYEWVWIDTCCIDKSSSSELSEAINSMFAWYKEAEVCYVYLDDVPAKPAALYISATLITDDIETVRKWEDDSDDESSDDSSIYKDMEPDAPDEFVEDGSESERWLAMFKDSRWFTRGWTLQELIAPRESVFLAQNWSEVGTRKDMVHVIEEASRVHCNVLLGVLPLEEVSIADRMRWASRRSTTRVEDRAYSLMGLFGIHMPTIYGEGIEAFMRLQHEILQRTTDHTIFAWTFSDRPNWDSCLTHGPECFSHIRLMEQIPYTEYSKIFGISDFLPPEHSLTNFGIRIHLPIRPHKSEKGRYLAALACYDCRTPRYK